MPEVTVVIPCYNHGAFVRAAIDSVLSQTFDDLDILVVNDGSTEPGTLSVLQELDLPKTRVLHKENGHLSSARNHGIAQAKSEFILTLDADDTFEPTFLEKAMKVIRGDDRIAAVTCDVLTVGPGGGEVCRFPGGTLEDFLYKSECLACCLFRRKVWEEVGGFDESMKEGYEDWNFWIAVTKRGWRIGTVPEPLYHYRVASDSMVAEADRKRPRLVKQIVSNHREVCAEHVEDVVYEKEMRIRNLEERLNQLRGSTAYRVGRLLCHPLKSLGNLLSGRSSEKD